MPTSLSDLSWANETGNSFGRECLTEGGVESPTSAVFLLNSCAGQPRSYSKPNYNFIKASRAPSIVESIETWCKGEGSLLLGSGNGAWKKALLQYIIGPVRRSEMIRLI